MTDDEQSASGIIEIFKRPDEVKSNNTVIPKFLCTFQSRFQTTELAMTGIFAFVFFLTGKEYVHGAQFIECGIQSAKEQEKRVFERACPFEFEFDRQATNVG